MSTSDADAKASPSPAAPPPEDGVRDLSPPPGPMDPVDTMQFASIDGARLYGEWFAPEQADAVRGAVLVLHGYMEHCGRYRELAHVLVRAGFAVLSYDMRGHGRADGQRGYIAGFSDYLADLKAAFKVLDERVQALVGEREIARILLGHSTGSLVALRALIEPAHTPEPLAAAVLSSPYLALRQQVSPLKDAFARLAGRFLPTLSLPNALPLEHLSSDPEKLEERRVDTLCHDVASSGWYLAVQEAQALVAENAHRIEVPTLWLVSGGDRIVDVAQTRVVHARLSAPNVYHEFEGFEHEGFNERERARVFACLCAYLDDVLAGVRSAPASE
ncbi:alpha/beta hydrolase [Haliangium ochraceum]|uniref:Alpha/beta hydrolase fold protein n=1 Tax=Haliangium ochraceum (strain DSM 14365 / JCM 11303 / SMP-2) TaxID=502025 RepID=D0LWC6_HALO1|nr:alpha/beta hydrolase [Haliangium ochraceum]ACY16058.1 alpha/beta hydrolase fold protein [Haliangium ochraceum DSM 14365]